jgi:hypothetical protein
VFFQPCAKPSTFARKECTNYSFDEPSRGHALRNIAKQKEIAGLLPAARRENPTMLGGRGIISNNLTTEWPI